MELQTLPLTARTSTPKYVSVKTFTKRPSASINQEFLYFGQEKPTIDSLLGMFNAGYCFKDVQAAQSAIISLVEKKKAMPSVVFLESRLEKEAIEKITSFLSLKGLGHLPVLVNVPYLASETVSSFKEISSVDDVICINQMSEAALQKKIAFLSSIKKAMDGQEVVNRVCSENNLKDPSYICKRAFDIVVSLIGLIILSPLMLLIAIAIKLESRGPVFYMANRAGRGFRVFNFYKFRTMAVGADQMVSSLVHLNQYGCSGSGPVFFKVSNDPRITKVGAFLRNTSLDEIPQLFNVLKGDMSLVGNRPLPLYEAATLTTDEWAGRFMAPAGITGLWQIKKRGDKNMSAEERINLDIDYAVKHNFMYDLWIIANTPTALLQKEKV
ncbi:MAG TPA: sugar transferase [Parasegetibacter sp.]